ncbi:MAG: replication-associated recombination protein A [Oscillospiraceae bacterium]|jgi:putative ATPase|nr:replication-associated recombination protein A [Oscillospiraceae bacterium]
MSDGNNNNYRPLADLLRPDSLEDFVGQRHILGQNGLLRKVIQSGKLPNMIFYGPSGTGKTTAANIIAKTSGRTLRRLNATNAGLADIKEIVGELGTFAAPNGVLLYLDEIQYFNKKQQQSLLEFIESGEITLIASTTENPYFYVYNAILSRCAVFEFKPIGTEDIADAIRRAVRRLEEADGVSVAPENGVLELIAAASGGDARRALNALELLYYSAKRDDKTVVLSLEDAQYATDKSAARYDKKGDDFYDCASALQKSIRGSDPDAALHYLARMLVAGDIIMPSRRLLAMAAEDIGLADPRALPYVVAAVQAAERLGMPEARIPLASAAVFLATCPKSNSTYVGIGQAMADVSAGRAGSGEIPRHLQNKHADGTGFEREQGYLYPHDFPNHWTRQQYMPDALKGKKYYIFGDNKNEQAAKKYWDAIEGE